MYWLNNNRMRLVVVGAVAAVVLSGGGNVNADFVVNEPVFIDEGINNPGTGAMNGHSLLHNGLKLYHTASHGGTAGIWVSERKSMDSPWGEPVIVLQVWGVQPAISPDELEIYFHKGNVPDLFRSTRASKDEPWGPSTKFNEFGDDAWGLDFSPDGLTVYFDSMRSGGYGGVDIWMATRETGNSPWNAPVNLGENVNGPGDQSNPSISNDGLALFFNTSDNDQSVFMCVRASIGEDWGPAIDLDFDDTHPVTWGSHCTYGDPEISPDGSTLYLQSHRENSLGNSESIWQASINPIVDLNIDGIVDAQDMSIMVDQWGMDNKLCDIGPMPWGDGIVDVQDLTVLAEHLLPVLASHWKLDEIEGGIAYDSAGVNDALVVGGTTWQPNGGQIDGALQLDGASGHAITDPVLNPSDRPFSVVAWIKGGAPGQVIVSQQNTANWLAADAEGNLMTQLRGTGRSTGYLISQTTITDGQWHCIGFVWDGTKRILYVDDVTAAEDTQADMRGSDSGLYIGTGMAKEPGTFWSGLIDDVRIYRRALSAEEIADLAQ